MMANAHRNKRLGLCLAAAFALTGCEPDETAGAFSPQVQDAVATADTVLSSDASATASLTGTWVLATDWSTCVEIPDLPTELRTYKLVRVMVIVLSLVVAYPYIPGSSSEAFKGISLFIGLVFSLGSSYAICNIIAGYMMTYRRAFKVGDRVKIGSVMGDVTEMRLQVTHLRTVKNEAVIIPNSQILNHEVINYSAHTRAAGLILHTTVGIGYETPWRQVEAMLLEAAARTPGLLKEPAPFVRMQSLGDFAVNYEINAHCDDAQAMGLRYTELHANILDLFNEYGVQIMTPAYEGDTPEPKVVPKDQWYAAPAKPPAGPA